MNKFRLLFLGALPVLMLAGCATTGDATTPVSMKEDAPYSATFANVGRKPADASLKDCADPSLTTDPSPVDLAAHWEDGTFIPSIGVNGGRASKQIIVNQVVSVKNAYNCNDTCYQWVSQAQADPNGWDDYSQCEATGSGQSDLWNAFYSATAADKPTKLDAAIKGVGPTNAANLIKYHVFDKKPCSWSAFVGAMQNAQDMKYLTPGIFSKVTSTYAVENMQNLGYDAAMCTPVHHSDSQTVWTQVPYTCGGTRYGVDQRSISTAMLPVTINVGRSVLQSFELDHVGVSVGYDGQNFVVRDAQASVLNRYYFSNTPDIHAAGAIVNQGILVPNGTQNVNVFFTEGGRNLINLPSDILGNVQLSSAIKSVLLTVPVNLGARQPSSSADQMVLSYGIEQCDMTGHWYLAGLRTCGKYYTVQAMKDVPLQDGQNSFTIPSDVDHKIRVTYRVSRRNSIYYNSNATLYGQLEQKAHK